MKKVIFCLIGESRSGKDTALKEVLSMPSGKYYRPVISYTSRPKRDNETEGVEHYFLSPEEMEIELKKARENDDEIAYTIINGYDYFAKTSDVLADDGKYPVYIIDPSGAKFLKLYLSTFKEEVIIKTIYIDSLISDRIRRGKDRGDDIDKYISRVESEQRQFLEFLANEEIDVIIRNTSNIGSLALYLAQTLNRMRRTIEHEEETGKNDCD